MHTRYITSALLALAGGFVVASSQAFASGTTAWLAFGIGIAALVLAAAPALFREKSPVALSVDGLGAVLAIWTIVASVVFHGDTVLWLSFAEGAGFFGLALASLTLDHVRLARSARATLAPAVPVSAPAAPSARAA
jgi:hypothetical protein